MATSWITMAWETMEDFLSKNKRLTIINNSYKVYT